MIKNILVGVDGSKPSVQACHDAMDLAEQTKAQLTFLFVIETPQVIPVAREHAVAMGLQMEYLAGEVQELEGQFDLVTCMEVIEHVADPALFLRALAARLASGGLLIMSTPNATGWSRLMMITLGEGLGRIPRGTHDFEKFLTPERLKLLLAEAGLRCIDIEGIAFSPTRGLHLSDDVRLNYLVSAVRI